MSFTCMASRLKRTNERSLLSSRSLAYAAPKSPGGTVFEESDSMATLPLQAIAAGPAEAAPSGLRQRVHRARVTARCIPSDGGGAKFAAPPHHAHAPAEGPRPRATEDTSAAGRRSRAAP